MANASSAILAIDPDGVAKELNISPNQPISNLTREEIQKVIAVQSEKGPSPQEQLKLYMTDYHIHTKGQRLAAIAWVTEHRDTEWWKELAIALDDSDASFELGVLAKVLYKDTDAKEQIIKVLGSEDRYAVRGMLYSLRTFGANVKSEDLRFWPRHIVSVLEKCPDLNETVARALAEFKGPEAKKESKRLYPFLLTEDPNQTRILREHLTAIDVETATALGIAMTRHESTTTMLRDESTVLTQAQWTKVLEFLRE